MTENKTKINYTIRKLPEFRDVTENTIEAITNVNCAAFKGDSYTKLLLGGYWDLAPCMERAFLIDSLKGGQVYVAELWDGTIVGDAMWHRPGDPVQVVENANANGEGFYKFFSVLAQRDPDVAKWWANYYVDKFRSFTEECLATYGNKRASWHLHFIGVLPEYRRYGIGTAFINVIEDQITDNPYPGSADRKISLNTETQDARKFFQKLGFVERGETVIEGFGDLGTCPMWHFVKDV